jgi:hypothetical protein
MTIKTYLIGTTIWLVALAQAAGFNPLDYMTDLAGNSLF